MRQGKDAGRMVAPTGNCIRNGREFGQMIAHRMTPDQHGQADIRHSGQGPCPPCFGTNRGRRQVAAFGIIARKAKRHWDDRNARSVIKCIFIQPKPVAQSFARCIPERRIGLVNAQARCLARDQQTCAGLELDHRIGTMHGCRRGKAVSTKRTLVQIWSDICHSLELAGLGGVSNRPE